MTALIFSAKFYEYWTKTLLTFVVLFSFHLNKFESVTSPFWQELSCVGWSLYTDCKPKHYCQNMVKLKLFKTLICIDWYLKQNLRTTRYRLREEIGWLTTEAPRPVCPAMPPWGLLAPPMWLAGFCAIGLSVGVWITRKPLVGRSSGSL